MDKITEEILREITDWDGVFSGAYSLRENGECISFQNSDHIRIVKKEDKPWASLPAEECDVQRIAAADAVAVR